MLHPGIYEWIFFYQQMNEFPINEFISLLASGMFDLLDCKRDVRLIQTRYVKEVARVGHWRSPSQPRRVPKPSGEYKSRITRLAWQVRFSYTECIYSKLMSLFAVNFKIIFTVLKGRGYHSEMTI